MRRALAAAAIAAPPLAVLAAAWWLAQQPGALPPAAAAMLPGAAYGALAVAFARSRVPPRAHRVRGARHRARLRGVRAVRRRRAGSLRRAPRCRAVRPGTPVLAALAWLEERGT
jgi:hypothetical protein